LLVIALRVVLDSGPSAKPRQLPQLVLASSHCIHIAETLDPA
jgi:hypothetical protein